MQRVSTRWIALLVLVALILPNVITLAQDDVVTIEWWTVNSEEYSEEAQRGLAAQFEAAHPNIRVNVTVLPESGFDERMTTTLGAGEGAPDVAFFWNTNWYPQALDLTPYIEADPDLGPETYFENFWLTRAVWGDKIVGLPLGVGANFVMYNKAVFDEAGVEYPTADWTTEDFTAIATALADPDQRRWGGDRPRGPFRAIWRNYGAFPYSDDSTTVEGYLNSDAAVAAYTWLWDLVASGATPTRPTSKSSAPKAPARSTCSWPAAWRWQPSTRATCSTRSMPGSNSASCGSRRWKATSATSTPGR
jgi:multiple sugar transport system substrate-binding protein